MSKDVWQGGNYRDTPGRRPMMSREDHDRYLAMEEYYKKEMLAQERKRVLEAEEKVRLQREEDAARQRAAEEQAEKDDFHRRIRDAERPVIVAIARMREAAGDLKNMTQAMRDMGPILQRLKAERKTFMSGDSVKDRSKKLHSALEHTTTEREAKALWAVYYRENKEDDENETRFMETRYYPVFQEHYAQQDEVQRLHTVVYAIHDEINRMRTDAAPSRIYNQARSRFPREFARPYDHAADVFATVPTPGSLLTMN